MPIDFDALEIDEWKKLLVEEFHTVDDEDVIFDVVPIKIISENSKCYGIVEVYGWPDDNEGEFDNFICKELIPMDWFENYVLTRS